MSLTRALAGGMSEVVRTTSLLTEPEEEMPMTVPVAARTRCPPKSVPVVPTEWEKPTAWGPAGAVEPREPREPEPLR